jgi:hypothetical protein
MSYDELLPWRGLAQGISKSVLNPTHRLIIVTLMTYESSAKGAYFNRENISKELGLTYRAVLDNFHYLGDGLVWRDGKRVPCSSPKCKGHLGIIKTAHYARSGKAQNYRIDMKAIERLSSMNSGSPIIESMNLDELEHEPEHVEHEPGHELARTEVHPYKHNKQFNKQFNKRINVERWQVITSYLPESVKRLIKPDQNSENLLDELVRQGTIITAIRDTVAKVDYANAYKVGGLFIATLEKLAGVKSARENSSYPHCGKCDKETRQFDEPSEVNGVLTYNCPNCHPLRKQLEPRTPDGISFNNVFRDVNES